MTSLAQEPMKRPKDYPTLRKQIGDFESTFYGAHSCEGCGRQDIVKRSYEQGGQSWEQNLRLPEPIYVPHHCTHVNLFKKLAGRVLTVINASLSGNPVQCKAVKDLLKQEFAKIITRARELEGNRSNETTDSLDSFAPEVLPST